MAAANSHRKRPHKVREAWPKAGLRWPTHTNSRGVTSIVPLKKRPRYLQRIVRAIDEHPSAPGKRNDKKRFVDKCLSEMVIVATHLIPELKHLSILEWFAKLETQVSWANGRNMPLRAISTLFLEVAKARSEWKASPREPLNYHEHGDTAILMDHFQAKLGVFAQGLQYEVYQRAPDGTVQLVEQGGIEYLTSRGLLASLDPSHDIVSSELVKNVQRLTIGTFRPPDEIMQDIPEPQVHEIGIQDNEEPEALVHEISVGMDTIDAVDGLELGEEAMDCSSD